MFRSKVVTTLSHTDINFTQPCKIFVCLNLNSFCTRLLLCLLYFGLSYINNNMRIRINNVILYWSCNIFIWILVLMWFIKIVFKVIWFMCVTVQKIGPQPNLFPVADWKRKNIREIFVRPWKACTLSRKRRSEL